MATRALNPTRRAQQLSWVLNQNTLSVYFSILSRTLLQKYSGYYFTVCILEVGGALGYDNLGCNDIFSLDIWTGSPCSAICTAVYKAESLFSNSTSFIWFIWLQNKSLFTYKLFCCVLGDIHSFWTYKAFPLVFGIPTRDWRSKQGLQYKYPLQKKVGYHNQSCMLVAGFYTH